MLRKLAKLGLVLVILIAAAAWWKREEITRLMAVNSLFAPENITRNFSHMDDLFLTHQMSRGDGAVSPLPAGPALTLPQGFNDWVGARSVTSVVVLQNGKLVHESYYQGTGPDDLRISWSMAKSVLSALFGIVLEQGAITSLDDPVTKYAPELAGSAYDGTTIRQVLTMSSGVKFNEDYLDFFSDINKMGRVLAFGGSMDDFAAGLDERDAEPGTRWHYVSIDTHVIGMVIRGATGRDIPDLLQDTLFFPMGLETAPYYVTDGLGVSFVLGGLNMTTRDYARVGQLFLQNGQWQGKQLVPADWVAASTRPQAPGRAPYGFQWWIEADAPAGEFYARGIYGQYIYINRATGVVVAVTETDRGFADPGSHEQNIAIFRQIAGVQP